MAFIQADYLTSKKYYFQVYLLQIQAVKIKQQFMIQVFRLPNVISCIPFSLKNWAKRRSSYLDKIWSNCPEQPPTSTLLQEWEQKKLTIYHQSWNYCLSFEMRVLEQHKHSTWLFIITSPNARHGYYRTHWETEQLKVSAGRLCEYPLGISTSGWTYCTC